MSNSDFRGDNDVCRHRHQRQDLPQAIPEEGYPPSPFDGKNPPPLPPPVPQELDSSSNSSFVVLPAMQGVLMQQMAVVAATDTSQTVTDLPPGGRTFASEWRRGDKSESSPELLAAKIERAYAQFAKPTSTSPYQVLSDALALSSDDVARNRDLCFLSVMPNDPRIVVVHGLTTYSESFGVETPYQGRVLAFMGDRPDPDDAISLPPLLASPLTPAEKLFESWRRRVPKREVLSRFFRGKGEKEHLHPIPNDSEAINRQEKSHMPKLAYIPTSWAVHFVGGLSPYEALCVGERLAETSLTPQMSQVAEPLLKWLRAACCQRSGAARDTPQSAMSVDWTPVPIAEGDGDMKKWALRRMRRRLGLPLNGNNESSGVDLREGSGSKTIMETQCSVLVPTVSSMIQPKVAVGEGKIGVAADAVAGIPTIDIGDIMEDKTPSGSSNQTSGPLKKRKSSGQLGHDSRSHIGPSCILSWPKIVSSVAQENDGKQRYGHVLDSRGPQEEGRDTQKIEKSVDLRLFFPCDGDRVAPRFLRRLVGHGGEVINELAKKTGCNLLVKDGQTLSIYGPNQQMVDAAVPVIRRYCNSIH